MIVGLRAGARLGTIDVVASRGYGHLAKPVPASELVPSRWAYARRGVPLGNGRNFGLVVSPHPDGGPSGPGGDTARDGVPNVFDIAVPGTLTIDALAPADVALGKVSSHAVVVHAGGSNGGGAPPAGGTNGASAPAAGPPAGGAPASPSTDSSPWMSQLFLPMNETVNEDASGVTQAEIDSTLQANLDLKLLGVPTSASLFELDCNGLTFCSPGGSGQAALEGVPQSGGQYTTVAFPSGSADPANGYGELVGPNAAANLLGTGSGGGAEFNLEPDAMSSQIGSGDVITAISTAGGSKTDTPTSINFVFNTVPAISAYSDTAGDSGTVTYPDTSGLGTTSRPIMVAAGPNGDVVVTFTMFRPQRAGVAGAGEPAFMDIGHLWYALDYVSAPAPGQTTVGSSVPAECPVSSYSSPSSTISVVDGANSGDKEYASPPGTAMLVDSQADQPASSADTFSFTVDVSACMASKGTTFPVGQSIGFDISANSQSSHDHSNQTFWLERTS